MQKTRQSAEPEHGHEALGTPNAPTNIFTISQYNQITANAGYFQQFGRIKTQVDGRMDNFSYNNDGAGPAQGVILNTDRDRTEFRESVRVGYEFLPGYEVWTSGGLNQRVYDECRGRVRFPAAPRIWSVADLGEPGRIARDQAQRQAYREAVYQEITAHVDRLAARP